LVRDFVLPLVGEQDTFDFLVYLLLSARGLQISSVGVERLQNLVFGGLRSQR
jgi:hypothetical protein